VSRLQGVKPAHDFLVQTQNEDGGWTYRVGSASTTEPTALILMTDLPAKVRARGAEWLLITQKEDGGWGLNALDDESGWLTAWAALALSNVSSAEAVTAVRRGVDWLLNMPVLRLEDPIVQDLLEIDPMLAGWVWQPRGATWVEPTALALLILLVSGNADHPRFVEGLAFLRDRACRGGGWNFGNPINFGNIMPPTPYQTVLGLLALQAAGADPANRFIVEGVAAVEEMLKGEVADVSLAWGTIALNAWQMDTSSLCESLLVRQRSNGSWEDNPLATAAALLALDRQGNPFFRRK
jgi:hypothetical protein